MISIDLKARELMNEDGLASYPDECCGFFYGVENAGGDRLVTEILAVNNAKVGDKKRRFEISAKDYLNGEQHALQIGLQLLGVYHSHPNHPAIPSEHDRVAAQPYFSYIIISVLSNHATDIRSWRLNDNFQFEEEKIGTDILQNH